MSGLLIRLWDPAKPFYGHEQYVTPTGKRLHEDYVQKTEARKNYHMKPQLAVNNTCVWFNGEPVYTQDSNFETTIYIQQYSAVQEKPRNKIFRITKQILPISTERIDVRQDWGRKLFSNLSDKVGLL